MCTTVAIAIVAETCGPFTVLPALMNEYRLPELNVQNGVLKALSFLFEYIGEMGKDYVYAVTPLLEDALMDRDLVHRQTSASVVKHLTLGVYGLGCEDALQHLLNFIWPNIFEQVRVWQTLALLQFLLPIHRARQQDTHSLFLPHAFSRKLTDSNESCLANSHIVANSHTLTRPRELTHTQHTLANSHSGSRFSRELTHILSHANSHTATKFTLPDSTNVSKLICNFDIFSPIPTPPLPPNWHGAVAARDQRSDGMY